MNKVIIGFAIVLGIATILAIFHQGNSMSGLSTKGYSNEHR